MVKKPDSVNVLFYYAIHSLLMLHYFLLHGAFEGIALIKQAVGGGA